MVGIPCASRDSLDKGSLIDGYSEVAHDLERAELEVSRSQSASDPDWFVKTMVRRPVT